MFSEKKGSPNWPNPREIDMWGKSWASPIAGKVSETWKQNQVLRCPINTSGVYLPPALPLFLTFGPELHGVWSNWKLQTSGPESEHQSVGSTESWGHLLISLWQMVKTMRYGLIQAQVLLQQLCDLGKSVNPVCLNFLKIGIREASWFAAQYKVVANW